MPIVFSNSGLIDLRAIRTFGLSVKPLTDNPIGFFGTGLKHALAILLRTKHTVTLYRGLVTYTFKPKTMDSRGKAFDVVFMEGSDGSSVELPFTLELAKTWEVWQAYRELHSNVLDERGETYRGEFTPTKGQTAIVVEGDDIQRAYNERHTIFLPVTSEPMPVSTIDLEIHKGENKHVYYRGVRVGELRKPSLYTYNLKNLVSGLTEDRTMKSPSDLDWYLVRLISESEDRDFIISTITADEGHFEHDLINYASKASDTFLKTYSEARETGKLGHLVSFATSLYLQVKKVLPLPAPIDLNKIQKKQLEKALTFCRAAGWEVDKWPIVVVPHMHGSNLLALAESGKIILTLSIFDMGIKTIVHALLEESLHLETGLRDHTRELQTHLFRKIICMAEQMQGEAL